jgi:Ca2+-binding EF-hand superfamily protein
MAAGGRIAALKGQLAGAGLKLHIPGSGPPPSLVKKPVEVVVPVEDEAETPTLATPTELQHVRKVVPARKKARPTRTPKFLGFRGGMPSETEPQVQQIDWQEIAKKLPHQKSKEATEKRKQLFNKFDTNGNGVLSLAEVDKGCRDVLQLQEIFDCKPVVMRAFQAAKSINQSEKANDDFVDLSEFRLLLLYLRQYFELYVMFDAIDTSDDRRITEDEFVNAVALVEKWGVKPEDPIETFQQIDANGGGAVLFDEFADWAIRQKLDLPDDDDAPDAGLGSGLIAEPQPTHAKKSSSVSKASASHVKQASSSSHIKQTSPSSSHIKQASSSSHIKQASSSSPKQQAASPKQPASPQYRKLDWQAIAAKLPFKQTKEEAAKRKKLFSQFDPNGNGLLSLAEVEKGCRDVLHLHEAFDYKPVLMRAFQAAKSINQEGKRSNNDFIEVSEFRLLLLYIRQYLELYVMFDAIDTSDDRRITEDEFVNAVALVGKWGVKPEDPIETFQQIDANGGGAVLFDEFAAQV